MYANVLFMDPMGTIGYGILAVINPSGENLAVADASAKLNPL